MSIEVSEFKRGLMSILIDDEDCTLKLTNLLNKTQLQAFTHEEKASRLRREQKEIEELMIFLNTPEDKK